MSTILTPTVRRWAYRTGVAAIALLVGYGILEEEHALLWVALLAPLLGLADANVPTSPRTRAAQLAEVDDLDTEPPAGAVDAHEADDMVDDDTLAPDDGDYQGRRVRED